MITTTKYLIFFFFQAEDGIRDIGVTGVQTCALPICTLNDAFVILDEAQNTTAEQMKMFLTRLGFGSKIVVTGDITQVDLPGGAQSGLRIVREILDGIEDVHFANLTSSDVVRHRLVGDIVDAYERFDATRQPTASRPATGGAARTARPRRKEG